MRKEAASIGSTPFYSSHPDSKTAALKGYSF